MFWKDSLDMQELPLSSKIGITAFLLLAGVGYLLGFANILLTYSPTDQEPGLSLTDIRIAFYGARDKTALEASIDGSMKQYFTSDADYEEVKAWLDAGFSEEGFLELEPIMAVSCNSCHSAGAQVAGVVTETYKDIEGWLVQDTGKSVGRLVSLTHTHLMSTMVLLFGLVMIFSRTQFSELIKRIVISVAFCALVADLGAWWLAKLAGPMAIFVILGGAALGTSFAAIVVLSLYDLWLRKTAK